MFRGVVRDAVAFNFFSSTRVTKSYLLVTRVNDHFFSDRAVRSAHPVEKLDFLDGMCGSGCSIEKLGSKRHFFDCVRVPDLVSDRKLPFSIHRSDCIRIGLTTRSFSNVLFPVTTRKVLDNIAVFAIPALYPLKC